jgi:hypothetical protein
MPLVSGAHCKVNKTKCFKAASWLFATRRNLARDKQKLNLIDLIILNPVQG